MLENLRVIVADDVPMYAEGLAAVLERRGIAVDEVVSNRSEVAGRAAACQAGMVVVGSTSDPAPMVDSLQRQRPDAAVIVLVDRATPDTVRDLIDRGVDGVLGRSCDADDVVEAVEAVRGGERHVGKSLLGAVLGLGTLRSSTAETALTTRQREIVQLLAEGRSQREIAHRLYVSPSTVKTHVSRVYEVLGVSSRQAAVARAIELGVLY